MMTSNGLVCISNARWRRSEMEHAAFKEVFGHSSYCSQKSIEIEIARDGRVETFRYQACQGI